MKKSNFEKWAINTHKSGEFKYNHNGLFVWFNHDFWGLDKFCKVAIFKQYETVKQP